MSKNGASKDGWVEDSSCASGYSNAGVCWDGSKSDGGSKSGGGICGSGEKALDGSMKRRLQSSSSPACGAADALSGFSAPRRCITHDSQLRCWYEYIPTPRPSSDPVPLVLDLHGYGGCGSYQACDSGWREVADSHGAVVVWALGLPDATGSPSWNAAGGPPYGSDNKHPVDDMGFLRALTAAVVSNHSDLVDAARVYAAGYSNGCMMAQRFALEASNLVVGVGCSSGNLLAPPADAPAAYSPVPVLLVHGTDDSTVSFDPGNAARWAAYNGCPSSTPNLRRVGDIYQVHLFDGAGCAANVALVEVGGGGHTLQGLLPIAQLAFDFLREQQLDWDAALGQQPQPDDGLSVGAIVGIACGGAVALFVLLHQLLRPQRYGRHVKQPSARAPTGGEISLPSMLGQPVA